MSCALRAIDGALARHVPDRDGHDGDREMEHVVGRVRRRVTEQTEQTWVDHDKGEYEGVEHAEADGRVRERLAAKTIPDTQRQESADDMDQVVGGVDSEDRIRVRTRDRIACDETEQSGAQQGDPDDDHPVARGRCVVHFSPPCDRETPTRASSRCGEETRKPTPEETFRVCRSYSVPPATRFARSWWSGSLVTLGPQSQSSKRRGGPPAAQARRRPPARSRRSLHR